MTVSRPKVLVVGLGNYFRKLRAGVERYFQIVRLVDSRPAEELQLSQAERDLYLRFPGSPSQFSLDVPVDCAMILTPPAHHLSYLVAVAKHRIPVFVEKPLLTTAAEIPLIEQIVELNPQLYCSDFYPDVRAIPLRVWMERDLHSPLAPMVQVRDRNTALWDNGPGAFGKLSAVQGRLLEGKGPSGTFEGREWLWDPSQGGVLRDLMYHYITLFSYLMDSDITPTGAVLRTHIDGKEAPWRPDQKQAETYGLMKGITASGVNVTFEVRKFYSHNANVREFTLLFNEGTATMIFADPNILALRAGGAECRVHLSGDYYKHVALAFRTYLDCVHRTPYGLDHAFRAVRIIDTLISMAGSWEMKSITARKS